MNSKDTFDHWFITPLQWLRAVPNNDGSFIALAAALFLYERYIVAKIESVGGKSYDNGKFKQIASDFDITQQQAGVFWKVMRNGILHQGMPKIYKKSNKLPDWIFNHDPKNSPIEFRESSNKSLLIVQPWLIVDKVINLWKENLHLLDQDGSFPWAQVSSVRDIPTQQEFYKITGSSSGLINLGLDDDPSAISKPKSL